MGFFPRAFWPLLYILIAPPALLEAQQQTLLPTWQVPLDQSSSLPSPRIGGGGFYNGSGIILTGGTTSLGGAQSNPLAPASYFDGGACCCATSAPCVAWPSHACPAIFNNPSHTHTHTHTHPCTTIKQIKHSHASLPKRLEKHCARHWHGLSRGAQLVRRHPCASAPG